MTAFVPGADTEKATELTFGRLVLLKNELHGFRLVAKSLGVVVLLPMDLMGAA